MILYKTWCIANLDFPTGPNKNTLLDILMALRLNNLLNQSLFINVDKHWSGNGHIILFLSQSEQEALLMIGNLIPYLTHHEGEWISTLFSAKSLGSNIDNIWDVKKICVIGAYSAEFDFAAEDNPIISAAIKFMHIAIGKPSIGIPAIN